MRLRILLITALIVVLTAGLGCGTSSTQEENDSEFLQTLADKVNVAREMETVDYLASENLKGRPAG